MLDHVDEGIQALEHDLGGVDLELADGRGRVNDLALQVAGVDDVEVDQADGADAGSGEVERERRAESAGADAEDLRGLQLLLALHAHLGQDQVARVARDLFVGELGEFDFGSVAVAISMSFARIRADVLICSDLVTNHSMHDQIQLQISRIGAKAATHDGEHPPAMDGMMVELVGLLDRRWLPSAAGSGCRRRSGRD